MTFCGDCQGLVKYNERFDAYFCVKCDSWRSPKCSERTGKPCDVGICTDRPEKPSMVEGLLGVEVGEGCS